MDEYTEEQTALYAAAKEQLERALEVFVQEELAQTEDLDIVSVNIGAWVIAHEETLLFETGETKTLSHAFASDKISPAAALELSRYGELAAPRWSSVVSERLD